MLHRIILNQSTLDLTKQFVRNVVFFFVYFFMLLFWMRFIGVDAQGNHGVIINNQKFNDSSGIQTVLNQTKVVTSTTSQVNISFYDFEGE